jgi:hypothetical protein
VRGAGCGSGAVRSESAANVPAKFAAPFLISREGRRDEDDDDDGGDDDGDGDGDDNDDDDDGDLTAFPASYFHAYFYPTLRGPHFSNW